MVRSRAEESRLNVKKQAWRRLNGCLLENQLVEIVGIPVSRYISLKEHRLVGTMFSRNISLREHRLVGTPVSRYIGMKERGW